MRAVHVRASLIHWLIGFWIVIPGVFTPTARGQEFLYTISTNGHLHRNSRINGSTIASVGVVPVSGIQVMGMSFYNGQMYVLDQTNDQIITIDLNTAQVLHTVHVSDPSGDVFSEGDFTISPTGQGYYSESNSLLERVSIQTGAASIVSSSFITNADGLAFGPNGVLYALQDVTFGGARLYTVDQSTGATALIGSSSSANGSIGALAFRSDGGLFAGLDSEIYSIDSTGHFTDVGFAGNELAGMAFVPEPSSFVMAATCIGGLLRRPRLSIITRRHAVMAASG